MTKKILILKNDRGGDLFTSTKLISSLISSNSNTTIYLSELNHGFSFLFKRSIIKKTNFNLNFLNKLNIFIHILLSDYDKIYILTPKNFYFFLPMIFKKIKFYAIVYDNYNKKRPSNFFRKFLHKYKIIYRNKINLKSYRDLQLDLLDNNENIDHNHSSLYIPEINQKIKSMLPQNFFLFQFRYLFFENLGWGITEFDHLISKIHSKYEYILFSSDLENNKSSKYFNTYFKKNYSIIDTDNHKKIINNNNQKTFYLDNINSLNLFILLKLSDMNMAKEGLFGHISYFHNRKCHNLFNFEINSHEDFIHQKISYSEWCKNMKLSFSLLNNDINKATRKILKNI